MKFVYLDQNMWINLARAYHGRADGAPFSNILMLAQQAVRDGTAVFPISLIHLYETLKTSDRERRRRLAEVMSELSEAWTIAPAGTILPKELRTAVGKLFGREVQLDETAPFGKGISFAVGYRSTLRDEHGLSEEEALRISDQLNSPVGMLQLLESANEQKRKAAISALADIADQIMRKTQEELPDFLAKDNAARRKEYASHKIGYYQDEMLNVLDSVDLPREVFTQLSADQQLQFVEMVPNFDVSMRLRLEDYQDRNRKRTDHDLADLTFLGLVIPYCDVVIMESYWAHVAKRTNLDKKYGTTILTSLVDLEPYLTS